MKKALITGVTGQDGSYLADLLLEKGYEVHGLVRRNSTDNKWRIQKALKNGLILEEGDITDSASINQIFYNTNYDECYNLAAQSDVKLSWDQPVSTALINGVGPIKLLEAIRLFSPGHKCKFYQASTSELFGNSPAPQNETTPFDPRSPYGVSKAMAHYATINYRESYGLYACCGILFNHESPRRGNNFVTQKVIKAAKEIAAGERSELALGNLSAARDWSHAKDMVYGMWLMLQQDHPEEYVLASGESWTIASFVDTVFKKLNLDPQKFVVIDPAFVRPAEVNLLCGDSSKARRELGWKPQYSDINMIIDDMLKGEL